MSVPDSGEKPAEKRPFVSCIVPVHNEAAELPRTIENLMAQDYPADHMEIVVALNGCTDASAEVAGRYPVIIAESPRKGMSFGKNLGAGAARGEFFLFIDADTTLPANGVSAIMERVMGTGEAVVTVAGQPERGGGVVRVCFWIMNWYTRRKRVHALGGVVGMSRRIYEAILGFDERLPQGTSTDVLRRGIAAGAAFLHIDTVRSTTSIRRFEKTGIIRQMFSWRRNHRLLSENERDVLATRHYEDIR